MDIREVQSPLGNYHVIYLKDIPIFSINEMNGEFVVHITDKTRGYFSSSIMDDDLHLKSFEEAKQFCEKQMNEKNIERFNKFIQESIKRKNDFIENISTTKSRNYSKQKG